MGQFDQGWYDIGSSSQYPFDQSAALEDDNGKTLPCEILADMALTMPSSLGNRLYCSGISKQDDVASLVFAGDGDGRPTVAVATIPLTASERRPVLLDSLVDSVRGTVVPGSLLWTMPNGTWRFTNPQQSYLSQRCVYLVAAANEQDIRLAYGPSPLESVIRLVGDVNVSVKLGQRVLGGSLKRSVIFSLVDTGAESALKAYAGQYQQRPEARTCGSPEPVETINLIQPNCCGQIFFELRGCARPIPISNHCGVVLDCPMEADEMCQPKQLVPDPASDEVCRPGELPDPIDPPPVDKPVYPPWWSNIR